MITSCTSLNEKRERGIRSESEKEGGREKGDRLPTIYFSTEVLLLTKGKFGISPVAVAVLAFCFAVMEQPLAVLLICGFALLAEKDEWLSRQTLQALLLVVVFYIASMITGLVFGFLGGFFLGAGFYRASSVMTSINVGIDGILGLGLLVFTVIAIVRVLRKEDAGIPWISKLASGDIQEAFRRAPKPPVNPGADQQAATQAPPSRLCASCGAPLPDGAKFCMQCGTEN